MIEQAVIPPDFYKRQYKPAAVIPPSGQPVLKDPEPKPEKPVDKVKKVVKKVTRKTKKAVKKLTK